MRTCDEHGIVYEELKKGRVQPCPVCDCEDEIARHEETNEILRKKLEEMAKKAEDYRDMVAKYEAENAALKQKLEKAHMDLANAEHNVAENTKQEIMMWIDKCIALEQKLVAVKEWMDSRQADSVVKLRKILDGE